ncbi:thioredoxin [Penicillium angulare]|uniref:Thioredoxin n=1 Tax=Penicillium angulare TaxID=116970 RepID=A0A9W9ET33_9EURO|nr:thioredoxin [Penicillium angulare]
MSTILEITSQSELSSYLASLAPSTVLVIYFYTPWTEYSTQMSTGMTTLSSRCQTTTPPTTSFVRINAKSLVDIAKEYNVSKAPYVVFLRDGQVIESIGGVDVSKVHVALERHVGVDNIAVPLPVDPTPSLEESKEAKEAMILRLTELVRSAPVMSFMKGTPKSPLCRFSRRLVAILDEHNIEYESFNILADEDIRQGLKEFGDWPTFPQLWIKGQLVGGLEIVREEIKTDPGFMRQCSVTEPVVLESSA